MDNKTLSVQEQEAIIAEYLLGEISYRSLGKNYIKNFSVPIFTEKEKKALMKLKRSNQ